MNRMNRYLAAAFALQLAVVLGVYLSGQQDVQARISQDLVTTAGPIERLRITAENGDQVSLALIDGQWSLPELNQLPADKVKVEHVLNKLKQTRLTWPVTTRQTSHERFKVKDDLFVRKLLIESSAGQQSLLLGTSPGFRQLHLRRGNEQEVYAVKLNSYDFPANGDDWLDKSLLSVDGTVTALTGGDFQLQLRDGQWILEDQAESPDPQKVTELLSALQRLKVSGVADQNIAKDAAKLTLTVDGEDVHFQLGKHEDQYLIRRSDHDVSFKLSKSLYQKLSAYSRDHFLTREQEDSDSAESS